MANPVTQEIRRLQAAARFSWQGLRMCWRNEAAFRTEVVVAVFFIPFGLWYGTGGVEKALLAGSCLIVMITELLNSAVEAAVDRISAERHELSGLAKDLGSAAVMVSMMLFWVTWGSILIF